MSEVILKGDVIIAGECEGELLASPEPLSFWGGYDYHTGEITDRRHPLSGEIAAGKVLGVPFSRGSSTTTAVLLEAVRAGTAALHSGACRQGNTGSWLRKKCGWIEVTFA